MTDEEQASENKEISPETADVHPQNSSNEEFDCQEINTTMTEKKEQEDSPSKSNRNLDKGSISITHPLSAQSFQKYINP